MSQVNVQIVNKSRNPLPKYQTKGSAGMDLAASEYKYIHPGETKAVSTGLFIAVPEGYEMQIRPRSGLAAKKSITVMNSPGTVDSDYRGEIVVLLHNAGEDPLYVEPGDRIAQMVLSRVPKMVLLERAELEKTERGTDGFGSTGR